MTSLDLFTIRKKDPINFFILASDVVIYDFACGLHNYCLNREAKFFQKTKFLIDRYHQPNHKGEVNNGYIYYSCFCKSDSVESNTRRDAVKFHYD